MILEFENHNPKYVSSGTSWKVEFIHLANFIHYEKNSRDGYYGMVYYDKDNTCSRYGVFRGGEIWGGQRGEIWGVQGRRDVGCSGEERCGVFRGGEMWGVQGGEMWGVQGRKETKFPISTSKSTCYFSAKF